MKILQQYLPKIHDQIDCFKNILNTCLRVEDEQILCIGDTGYENHTIAPVITTGYYHAAKQMKMDVKVALQSPLERGEEAEEQIVYALADLPKKSTIVMNMSSRIGKLKYLGKSFRAFTKQKQHRFISASSWGNMHDTLLPNAVSALNLDYHHLRDRCQSIKEQLDPGKILRVTTEAGTDLTLNIYGKKGINNHGIYTDFGTGGNLPAGEVYLPPRARKKNNGTIVLDGSLRTLKTTIAIKKPVTLTIENSEIVDIRGGDEAIKLQESIDWALENSKYPWGVKRLCEFGIGCNPNAELIGAMIVDEKAHGTAHIAHGSNNWFGGTIFSIIHLDHVFRNPKIFIDEEPLKIP